MAKTPTRWTMSSWMASGLDKKEDAFGARLFGLTVEEFKSLPEAKELDALYVKLGNAANRLKAKKGKK